MRASLSAMTLVPVCFLASAAHAAPSEALWKATVHVESRGDPRAYNAREGAAGIVQIRMGCLADVNRIARLKGLSVRFTSSDRYKPARARKMWKIYLDYYGTYYARRAGRVADDEVYARIWNGGPSGYRKRATAKYWKRIREAM